MKNNLFSLLILLSVVIFLNSCNDEEPMVPVATATPNAQAINSGASTSIALTSDIQGTTFTWTVVQSGVTGATAGSGTSIAQTLTLTGLVAGTATYTITPTYNGVDGLPINVVVTVNMVKTTYNADVKSILVASCAPCHLAGGANPNKWDQYDHTKAKINSILDRVQRDVGSAGFMPRNGAKMPADKIAILKKWVDDGLLEK